jgi:CBS domain-containing protein
MIIKEFMTKNVITVGPEINLLDAHKIMIDPDALTVDALRGRAWQEIEPQYLARLARLIDEFGKAKSRALGADELAQVAEAAVAGRVATLLIEADRQVPGRDGRSNRSDQV